MPSSRNIRLRYVMPIATAILTLLGWLFVHPVRAVALNTVPINGLFVDAQGNGVNGILTLQLPVPAQFNTNNVNCGGGTSQIIQNGLVTYNLINGNIQSGPPVFDVNCLQPANLFYIATVYDRAGNLVMRGNYVITLSGGGASFNIGTATPTTITTSNISYANLAGSVNTGSPNTWTATQTFSQINSSGPNTVPSTGFLNLANTNVIEWENGNFTSNLQLGLNNSASGTPQGNTTCSNGNPCLVAGGAAQTFAGTGSCPANQFANSLNAIALAVPGTPTCAAVTVLASGATGTNTALTTPTIGGTTITNVPWMVGSSRFETSSINASNTNPIFIATVAGGITVKEFDLSFLVGAASCTGFPSYVLYDETAASAISTITLANGTTQYRNTGLSVAVANTHVIDIHQSAGGTGCSTNENGSFSFAYLMQ